MKTLKNLFIVVLVTINFSILKAQDLQGFDYRLFQTLGIQITEETKDVAYSTSSSAMVGTWINSDGKQMVLNANGTGTLYEPYNMSVVNRLYDLPAYSRRFDASMVKEIIRGEISKTTDNYGVKLLWTQPFTWSKKGIHFNMKFSVKGKVSVVNDDAYKNLSPRKKDEVKENVADMNGIMLEVLPSPGPYNLDYFDKNIMILTEYRDKFVYVNLLVELN